MGGGRSSLPTGTTKTVKGVAHLCKRTGLGPDRKHRNTDARGRYERGNNSNRSQLSTRPRPSWRGQGTPARLSALPRKLSIGFGPSQAIRSRLPESWRAWRNTGAAAGEQRVRSEPRRRQGQGRISLPRRAGKTGRPACGPSYFGAPFPGLNPRARVESRRPSATHQCRDRQRGIDAADTSGRRRCPAGRDSGGRGHGWSASTTERRESWPMR